MPGVLLAAVPARAQRPASDEAWRTDVPCAAGDDYTLAASDSATETRVPMRQETYVKDDAHTVFLLIVRPRTPSRP
ncbi:MAG TPA: hypothetical protein VF142_15730 [Longimicrobium sp.]